MNFKKILGDYAPVDELWLPVFDGDDSVKLLLKSPKHWLPQLTKLIDRNRNATTVKSATLKGNKDIVVSNTDEVMDAFTGSLQSDIDFLLEHVIVDWKNITDENDVELKYSVENAKATLFNSEFNGVRELVLAIFTRASDNRIFNENQAELHKVEDEIVKK